MKTIVARRMLALVLSALLVVPSFAWAAGPDDLDWDAMTRIRDEGFRHSRIMETMSQIADQIGPRLTGSPNMKRANDWTRDQLAAWGLANAHLEAWGPYGKGWSQDYVNARMISPDVAPLIVYAQAWTPGTSGAVRGKAVAVNIQSKEDLEKYRGKLAGAMVLYGDMRDVKPHDAAEMKRYDEKGLEEVAQYNIAPPGGRGPLGPGGPNRGDFARQRELRDVLRKFWADEKVAAIITPGRGDGGTVFVQGGGNYQAGQEALVPMLSMAIEHYGRISRLVSRNVPVELEVDVRTTFYDSPEQWNTVAEIPGTDPKLKDEVVMLGGHLDSWHTGTGATDNGAGCAVMMEAVRILQALKASGAIKPRRTIRIALWSGEEEGLLGSRGYAKEHFGSRTGSPSPADSNLPEFMRAASGPLQLKPEQAKISAYFNVDNGTGRIRGIYTQENAAVAPIFTKWFEPFHDLSAATISMRNTGGTDHQSFDAVGIPGFQFIQDDVEYFTRTHHSNMDVYERIQAPDMMQNAVIVAAFVYNAAQRDGMMPRKPLPPAPPAPGAQRAATDSIIQAPANTPAVASPAVSTGQGQGDGRPHQ